MSSKSSSTIVAPRLICQRQDSRDSLEVSLHTLPKPLLREFSHVFGDNYVNFEENRGINAPATISSDEPKQLIAIPTNQQAREDLVSVGDHIESEKDRLLNVFIEFGRDLCNKLRTMGYWADFIDPCSGLPMLTLNCNKVYSEVDGMECLLNYKSYNAGFCKILTHPKWGSAVYPATVFAYAPPSIVKRLVGLYPPAAEK